MSLRRYGAVFAVGVVLGSARASAQCVEWSTEFHQGGVAQGYVATAAVFDDGRGDALYFAGMFSAAGEAVARSIVRWDGVSHEPLGSGITGLVRDLAVFQSGGPAELYAAGSFNSAGGTFLQNIARWNGSSWSPVGLGLTGMAIDLIVHDDGSGPALYVTGTFTAAGGVPAARLAKWDGAGWSVLPGFQAQGIALGSFDDGSGPALYSAGTFSGSSAIHIARWNGSSWASVGLVNGAIRKFVVHDDGTGPALYVGGEFPSISGVPAQGVARWNGSWSAVGGGTPQRVNVLATHDDGSGPRLFAGGAFTTMGGVAVERLASWDGASWSACGTSVVHGSHGLIEPDVVALAEFPGAQGTRLFVGGAFGFAGSSFAGGAAEWDGTDVTPLAPAGSGLDGGVYALETFDSGSGAELVAAGVLTSAGDTEASSIARWNGSSWSPLGSGVQGAVVDLAVHDEGGGDALHAIGEFLYAGGIIANNVARWDGSTWSALGPGLEFYFTQDGLKSVASFDDGSGARLYVGGEFLDELGATHRLELWDGAQWIPPSGGEPDNTVHALCVHDDGSGSALYAAGEFVSAGGTFATRVARWNGQSWSAVGTGLGGSIVVALHSFDDGSGAKLYAAGNFPGQVARWDGAQWTTISSGANDSIYTLGSFDDGGGPALYLGGRFTMVDGSPASRIARWNGLGWSAVGSGVGVSSTDQVRAIAGFQDGLNPIGSLYAGGFFPNAGGLASSNLARWSDPCPCAGVSYCTSGTTSSGCEPSISGFGRASASASTSFEIRATSLEGQRSGHLFYGLDGPHAGPWGTSSHYLCVKAPSQRTPTQPTGGTQGQCDGTMSLDWNAYLASHPSSLGQPFAAGQQVWTQAFFRDPAGAKTTALTNGLRFSLCP